MVAIEREIERAILSQKRWADLDNRMRDLIGSSQEYDKKISRYSVENQLRYRGNLVRFVVDDEYEYYRELLKYSRDHLMLFPYHLSDFIITGMRITPFQYYLSTMTQILEQEKSYDTLPNFTAADCLQLLGVGRNQYIDIMNELRSNYRRFLGIGIKRSARSILPNKPDKSVPIEPWWFVNAGYITEDDVRSMVTPAERSIIDRLVSPDGLSNQILACDLDEACVRSLYIKGLIYLDVPIYDDDFIIVPPLEGFVMNRVTGDYFETLLYKIFVSIDQSTPVGELATILEIDTRLVKNAVSMYCRLKFAYKKNIYIDPDKCHPSWRDKLEDYKKMGINVTQQITQPSRQVSDFITKLASAEDKDEGTEVVDNNPISLDSLTLNESRKNSMIHSPSSILSGPQSLPMHAKKIVLFYDSNLAAFLMMGNLSTKLKNHAVTMFEVGKLSDEWIDSLLVELSQIKSDALEDDGYEARRYYIHAIMLRQTIEFIRSELRNNSKQSTQDADDSNRTGLDLIRVESLSNLDSESCERFLKKNYILIISVAPLNNDIKLNIVKDLPHLGPGSPIINSLWFRMYIYHTTGYGPPSLLLLQGYRLSKLPEEFSRYDAILINHWNREPTCISTHVAINAINDALTHSPVLVQGYPIQPEGGNLVNGEEKVFLPLPIDSKGLEPNQESETSFTNITAVAKLAESIDLSTICGYITLLRSASSARKIIEERKLTENFSSKSRCNSLTPEVSANLSSEDKGSTVEEDKNLDRKDEVTLFECNFGIPLFDKELNEQVRKKLRDRNLCGTDTLKNLSEQTNQLNLKIEAFVEQFRYNRKAKSYETTDSGDQRHFFQFPDTEQLRCYIPRPAENLYFDGNCLSIFTDSQE